MNRLRLIVTFLTMYLFTTMHKSMAQSTEMLSDSLVYSIEMYQELLKEYTNKKALLQQDVVATVKKTATNPSKVKLNAKLEDTGIDLIAILDLADSLKHRFGIAITEEQAMRLATVNDIFEAVRPKGDTVMLAMAYYPWRMVFDSRSVHRVKVYEDGITILGDLIELTTDSIQREIYLDELMNVYDVWCENIDAINARTDIPYSKTLIKSDKARKYDEMLPIHYHLKWNVEEDTIKSKAIQENVFSTEVSRLYNYMQDALYDQESKGELYYEIPYKFFRLSHSRLNHLNRLGKFQTYVEQYSTDFDSVNARFEFYKTMDFGNTLSGNIAYRHNEVTDMYDEASGAILIGTSKDWREKEPEFRRQLYEKMELWDFGLEKPDPKFLNRIINGINTDSSEVYIEAMEIYITLPPTEEIFNNIIKYRYKLMNYYNKNERYDDAIALCRKLAGDEEDALKKSNVYFAWGQALEKKGNYQTAALRYKDAVSINPNFGNAYYYLAIAYSKNKWISDPTKDSYKYLLCIDKLELARKCIQEQSGGSLRSYNNPDLLNHIERYIASFKSLCPYQSDAFMLGTEYSTPGRKFTFPGGVMKGESTVIRFYN